MGSKKQQPDLLFPVEKNKNFSVISWNEEIAWPELQKELKSNNISLPLIFGEPELQFEALFHLAARECKIPTCSGSVYNLPLTLETVSRIKPDALVSTVELAHILLESFAKKFNRTPSFKLLFLFGDTISQKQADNISILVPNAKCAVSSNPIKK